MLEIFNTVLGSYHENSYLLRDIATGKTAVVDPGFYCDEYEEFLINNGVKELDLILLTHGHFDHICGVYPLKQKFGGKVLIHNADAVCLENTSWSLKDSVRGYEQTPLTADGFLEDNEKIMLGETEITVMHTPGHTKGSIIFISEGVIFSGDTLFRGTMGRTDLPGGSTKEIFKSLRAIGQIPGEYRILTGHGEETTLSYEKRNNRYLRANDTLHN